MLVLQIQKLQCLVVLLLPKEVAKISKEILLSYQPDYYKNSEVMENINTVNSKELNMLNDNINTTGNQMFVDTATTALSRWEKVLALQIANNYNTDYRRIRIITKLKGQGTTTLAMIKNLASSFNNGEIDVIEDNANYAFLIKFISIRGIPNNIEDLKNAIEEIKPAHLSVKFLFNFNTHFMLNQYKHYELTHYTHKQLKENTLEHQSLNTYEYLEVYTYGHLESYTYDQLRKNKII